MKSRSNFAALACDMGALDPSERQTHQERTAELFRTARAIHPLSNGFSLRLSNDGPTLARIAEFIAREQLCCPFLRFDLRVEPQKAQAQLRLTGGQGVKRFLQMELADLLQS